jgi:hypothetical protein
LLPILAQAELQDFVDGSLATFQELKLRKKRKEAKVPGARRDALNGLMGCTVKICRTVPFRMLF